MCAPTGGSNGGSGSSRECGSGGRTLGSGTVSRRGEASRARTRAASISDGMGPPHARDGRLPGRAARTISRLLDDEHPELGLDVAMELDRDLVLAERADRRVQHDLALVERDAEPEQSFGKVGVGDGAE